MTSLYQKFSAWTGSRLRENPSRSNGLYLKCLASTESLRCRAHKYDLGTFCTIPCDLTVITDTISIGSGVSIYLDTLFTSITSDSISFHSELPATSANTISSVVAPTCFLNKKK